MSKDSGCAVCWTLASGRARVSCRRRAARTGAQCSRRRVRHTARHSSLWRVRSAVRGPPEHHYFHRSPPRPPRRASPSPPETPSRTRSRESVVLMALVLVARMRRAGLANSSWRRLTRRRMRSRAHSSSSSRASPASTPTDPSSIPRFPLTNTFLI